jgi:hypothetical protein
MTVSTVSRPCLTVSTDTLDLTVSTVSVCPYRGHGGYGHGHHHTAIRLDRVRQTHSPRSTRYPAEPPTPMPRRGKLLSHQPTPARHPATGLKPVRRLPPSSRAA